ncbi:hypothetical protein ACFE6N_02905 [Pedobacter sp. BG31]|uniref:hypothetical protein n=1 Tax=Pedobacter sp. BG31 TaxID=3349697 RepID=UPI0035F3E095
MQQQSDSPNTADTPVAPYSKPAAAPSTSPQQVMQQQITDLKAQIAAIQQQALQAMQAQVDSSFQTLAASSLQMVNNQAQAAAPVVPTPVINPIQQAINTVNTSVDAAMLAAQQSVKNAESMVNDPAQQTPGS